MLQARGIFTLPNALTSGGGGLGGGRGGNTLTVSTSAPTEATGPGVGGGSGTFEGTGGVEGKKENQWMQSIMHMVGNSIGLSVAYFMQKTSVTFGGCMMGSEYLLQSFEELADPLLERVALPTLKRTMHSVLLILILHHSSIIFLFED